MAEFRVHKLEGMQYVDIHLDNETARAEAGAFSYMTGEITMHSRLIPSIGGLIKSLLADEAVYRPTYTGTGVITLESSLGGFHILDLDGESWILERGTYWASEGSVEVSYHRERFLTSLYAGEGLIYLQTKVRGHGKVALTTRGPVEELTLERGKSLVAEGMYVIARTPDVSFKIRRPTKNFFGRYTSGEGWVRVYEGPGKVLLNPAPYWRYWMMVQRGDADYPSQTTF
ncbi:hypothetical protein OJF2_40420 [Aquisphaera giovannonii]|uniref:AIM24 family protein n=1 Tax=Aquisphaera giovannonii TaxID=406548 RepID=A0A5B9W689_9BACT|nr:AIM24 family protein [Aquisphaera giovannonii]QEH35490.1 hypothetical protein OJF2_40420 [Aquisphaera giovannonii]